MTSFLCAMNAQWRHKGVWLRGSKMVFFANNYYIHCNKMLQCKFFSSCD